MARMNSGVYAERPARRWPSPCLALSNKTWNFGPNFAAPAAAGWLPVAAAGAGGAAAGDGAGAHPTSMATSAVALRSRTFIPPSRLCSPHWLYEVAQVGGQRSALQRLRVAARMENRA